MSPKARQSKGKARLNRYEELVNQKQDEQAADLEIYIPPGPRLGDVVVEAKGVSKAYGDKVLYENVNFSLPKGGIVGVIGPNGAGKTTMFRMIIGKEKPDAGTIKIGETVKLGYVDQDRSLDPNKTVYDIISEGQDTIMLGKAEVNARGLLRPVQFRRHRSAEESEGPLRRRTQPGAPGPHVERRGEPHHPRRADQRSRHQYLARVGRRAWKVSPAAPSSAVTTAGFWTGSRRTLWRSKATARWSGSKGTTASTKRIGRSGWGRKPISRTGFATAS